MLVTTTIKLDRETKNTVVYLQEDGVPVLRAPVYIEKAALGDGPYPTRLYVAFTNTDSGLAKKLQIEARKKDA